MCNFFSLILTKDYAYSGPTDSHTDIIAYYKLREWDERGGKPTLVKYEVLPPDKSLSAPYHEWNIVVDQDAFPEWYAPETDKARVLAAVVKIKPRLALEAYEEVVGPAREAYKAVQGPAREAYKAVQGPALEAYKAVQGPAREVYEAVERPAWEAYKAVVGPAWEAYQAVERSAWEAYQAVWRPAWEAYGRAITQKVSV